MVQPEFSQRFRIDAVAKRRPGCRSQAAYRRDRLTGVTMKQNDGGVRKALQQCLQVPQMIGPLEHPLSSGSQPVQQLQLDFKKIVAMPEVVVQHPPGKGFGFCDKKSGSPGAGFLEQVQAFLGLFRPHGMDRFKTGRQPAVDTALDMNSAYLAAGIGGAWIYGRAGMAQFPVQRRPHIGMGSQQVLKVGGAGAIPAGDKNGT